MHEYRVTKYDPKLRNSSGAYTVADWISVRDIGKSFGGAVLTDQECRRVENAYIEAALAFLAETGLTSIRVDGLENAKKQVLDFYDGSVVELQRLRETIGRILRGEFWCRLEGEEFFIHFGWDYYMYVGVPHRCPAAELKAAELGLYVEEFASPYHRE